MRGRGEIESDRSERDFHLSTSPRIFELGIFDSINIITKIIYPFEKLSVIVKTFVQYGNDESAYTYGECLLYEFVYHDYRGRLAASVLFPKNIIDIECM